MALLEDSKIAPSPYAPTSYPTTISYPTGTMNPSRTPVKRRYAKKSVEATTCKCNAVAAAALTVVSLASSLSRCEAATAAAAAAFLSPSPAAGPRLRLHPRRSPTQVPPPSVSLPFEDGARRSSVGATSRLFATTPPRPPPPPPSSGETIGQSTSSSTGQQPHKYIRIEPKGKRRFELQTAVTTFTKTLPDGAANGGTKKVSVDLHSQLHFGDLSYYAYYNEDADADAAANAFASKYDRVHYELIVSENLIQTSPHDGYTRRITVGNPISASPADVNMASGYGLECQANVVDYAQEGWVNADLTREEFVEEVSAAAAAKAGPSSGSGSAGSQPIWALASTSAALFPGSEFLTALLRPATPSTSVSSRVTRRLFSNLFLPGDALAACIRSVLWLLVPSPEVSVMLLDWSSLSPRPTGGISPIALPVLECLLSGNVREARKLVFSQMVVSGQRSSDSGGGGDVLIGRRNERALHVLSRSIDVDKCERNALVYGAMHCRDLHRRLVGMGFTPGKTEWRTAWSVDVPKFGTGQRRRRGGGGGGGGGGRSAAAAADVAAGLLVPPAPPPEAFAASSSPTGIAIALVVVPVYLAIGGLDWLATIGDVGEAVGNGQVVDGSLAAVLYLVRHVALYLGLAKFVVEWDGANLFGGDGR